MPGHCNCSTVNNVIAMNDQNSCRNAELSRKICMQSDRITLYTHSKMQTEFYPCLFSRRSLNRKHKKGAANHIATPKTKSSKKLPHNGLARNWERHAACTSSTTYQFGRMDGNNTFLVIIRMQLPCNYVGCGEYCKTCFA